MSLLKKIFGKGKEEPAPESRQPSPAIPDMPAPPMPRKRVVRAPRVPVTALHRVDFVPEGFTDPVRLSNISTTGLGLLRVSFGKTPVPTEGSVLSGTLRFQERPMPVAMNVVHVSDTIVGCAIANPALDLKSAIGRYFELEIAALSMNRVDPKYHKKEPDGDAHWIHGGTSDLYYVTQGDQVLRFRLNFMGNQFEGGETIPLYVGQVAQDTPGEVRASTKVLHERKTVPRQLLEAVEKFLDFVPTLEARHRDAIRKYLAQVATLLAIALFTSAIAPSDAAAASDLYHRIGGKKKIASAISDLVDTLSADERLLVNPRLREASRKVNKPRIKMQLTERACHVTGGPCKDAPVTAPALPPDLKLSTKEWFIVVQDLNDVMARSNIPKREQTEILGLILSAPK